LILIKEKRNEKESGKYPKEKSRKRVRKTRSRIRKHTNQVYRRGRPHMRDPPVKK
jgi:hypothetical protein